jgi:hypothetical protein
MGSMLPSPLDALADWALVAIRLLGGVGSVTLAAALLYLVRDVYTERRDAAEIRTAQTELQERQTRLLAADHEPIVRRGEWGERAPDLLAVELGNEGEGVARDLRLDLDLDADSDAYDAGAEAVPLYRLDDGAVDTQAADLRAGETATFVAPLAVPLSGVDEFSDSTAPFSAAVEKLRYTGTHSAAVEVAVTYENVLGERARRTVLSGSFTLVEGLDFPAAMRLRTDDEVGAPTDRDTGFDPFRLMSGDATTTPDPAIRYVPEPGPRPGEYVLRVDVELQGADLVKFTRGDRVVASLDTSTDEPVAICGGGTDEPPIGHGELLHVHAVGGGNEVETDCFAAPDAVALPPRLPAAPPAERSRPVERSSTADPDGAGATDGVGDGNGRAADGAEATNDADAGGADDAYPGGADEASDRDGADADWTGDGAFVGSQPERPPGTDGSAPSGGPKSGPEPTTD